MHGKRGIIKTVFGMVFLFVVLSFITFYPAYHLTELTPQGYYYTKPHINLEDYYDYLSMIKQGRSGITGMQRYTTDLSAPQNLHVYYELLGQVASGIGVTDPMMYYLGIAAGLFVFILAALLYITTMVPRGYRLLAGLFVFFAGPVPLWWMPVVGVKLDAGIMDWTKTYIWYRYAMVPHHVMGVSLTVLATWFLLLFVRRKKLWEAGASAGLYMAASVVYSVPVFLTGVAFLFLGAGYGAYYGFLFFRRKISVRMVWHLFFKEKTVCVGVFMIGILTCGTILSRLDQHQVTEIAVSEYQTYQSVPLPFLFSVFVLSHGILLCFYPFALWRVKRSPVFSEVFLISITATPWILCLLSGLGIPMINKYRLVFASPYLYGGIVATLGVATIVTSVKKKFRGFVLFGITILILSTTVFGIQQWVQETKPKTLYSNIYISREDLEAVAYLDAHVPKYSRVLSTFYSGMYLPAFTNVRVYIGHESMPRFYEKFPLSEQFFSETMPMGMVAEFLKDNGIEYVFWDVPDSPDRYSDYLKEIFNNESVRIFKVVNAL